MLARIQPSSSSSNAASVALEQSNADLMLLTQSLSKSRRVTDKMTSLLSDFDDRLARLEKSLVPIHKQTGRLTRVSKSLESTVRSIDGLLGHHDLVERESPLISQGPNPDDLKPYMAAMDRLTSAADALRKTDAKGQNATLAQMSALMDTGARNLVKVFRDWVREATPPMDAGSLFDKGKAFPPLSAYFLEHAIPLLNYLRGLPDIGASVSKEMEFAYGDVRALYMESSLKSCAKDVVSDTTSAVSASVDRKSLGRFLDVFFSLAKSEHAFLGTVFVGTPLIARKEIYAVILPPSLAMLYTTGQQLNSLIKKSLHALIPIGFSSFTELQERSVEFEEWVRGKAGRKDNELGELLHAFRGTCLTSMPEFIEDTKTWANKPVTNAESTNAAVTPTTLSVVNFMRQLCENQTTVEQFLSVLGPGNWGGPQLKSPISGKDDDAGLLTVYLNDVLTVLLNALEMRARNLKSRHGVSAIFLLNNVSYIRREVLSSQIGDVLGESCEDNLNKRMRSVKASYLEIWSPLVSALLDAGLDQGGAAGAIKAGIGAVKGVGSEKRETKDRFVRFHDSFEEVEQLHHIAKLDEGETELRERLKGEVERMIVPTYSKFLARHRNGDFSKNPSKYLKLNADQLTVRMAALFDA